MEGLIRTANHLIKIYFFIGCFSAFSELGETAGDPGRKPQVTEKKYATDSSGNVDVGEQVSI